MKDKSPVLTASWRTHLLIIFFLLLLSPVHMIPLFPHISTHVPGDVMDTAEYPLNAWWTSHALLDLKTNPFNNDYMFFPLGENLVQHTYTFLDGLFYTLLRPFVPLIVFHNLLIWMTYFANAVAAYCLINYLTKTPWLAFIGALAFGHCPTLQSYYKTASLLELYNLVFFIFFSTYLIHKRQLKWVVLAGLFWGLTLYNYPYYFVFGGIWLLLLLGYQVCPWEFKIKTAPEFRISLWARGLVFGSLLGAILFPVFAPRRLWEFMVRINLVNWITLSGFVLVLVMIWMVFKFQALEKNEVFEKGKASKFLMVLKVLPVRWNPLPGREIFLLLGLSGITFGIAVLVGFPYFLAFLKDAATRQAIVSISSEFSDYSVDLISFFAPFNAWLDGLYRIIAPNWKSGKPIIGTPAFFGYGFMVILLVGIGQFFKRSELRPWLIAWGCFLILSLGPYLKVHGLILDSLPLPAYLIRYLPVIESARTLSRYLAPAMLFLCLLVCLIINPFYLRLPSWWKKIFLSALLLMVSFEYGLLPYPLFVKFSDYRIPEVYKVLDRKAEGRAGVLLDLPLFFHSGSRSAGHGETRRFYYQTVHKQKLIGGVSSKLDESVFVYFQNQPSIPKLWSIQPVEEDELAALIYAYHIESMVLDKRYYPSEILKTYRLVFDSAPYIKKFYEDPRFLGLAIDQQSDVLKEKALQYWGRPDSLFGLIYPNFSRPLEVNQTPPIEMIIPTKLWNHLEIEFSPETVRSFSGIGLRLPDKKEIALPFPSEPLRERQNPFSIRLKEVFPLDPIHSSTVRLTFSPGKRHHEQILGGFPFQVSLQSLGQATGFYQTPSQALINDKHFFIDQRGITAFRISSQGKILEKAHFDTHASIRETVALTGWLKNFSEQDWLGLLVYDEGSRSFSSEAEELLRTFGAKNPLAKENWQHSYVLLGKKGLSQGKAWEAHTVSSPAFIHSPGQVIQISNIRLTYP